MKYFLSRKQWINYWHNLNSLQDWVCMPDFPIRHPTRNEQQYENRKKIWNRQHPKITYYEVIGEEDGHWGVLEGDERLINWIVLQI